MKRIIILSIFFASASFAQAKGEWVMKHGVLDGTIMIGKS
jgi:hypothetical protein